MMRAVFYDLRYFLSYFALVVCMFSFMLSVLVETDPSIYDGIGVLAYFMIPFRTSIGDNDITNYSNSSDFKVLTWLVWVIVMGVGNIVFMNFIIAVVGESYQNCMQTISA